MQPGAVSDPIVTDNGTVIVKVLERQDPPPADVAKDKATLENRARQRAPRSLLRLLHGARRASG